MNHEYMLEYEIDATQTLHSNARLQSWYSTLQSGEHTRNCSLEVLPVGYTLCHTVNQEDIIFDSTR